MITCAAIKEAAFGRNLLIDSNIIASGLVNNVDLFVTNDRHFTKCLKKEMLLAFDL
jgi:hypothetical protein